MKKLLSTVLATVILTSCSDFLNVKPQGMVIPSADEEFGAIMHRHIQDIEGGADDLIIGNMETIARLEGIADDLDANIKVGSIPAFAGDLINTRMTDYREYFSIVKDCNIVIENLDGRTSKEASNVLACAYAIKGICYFHLMRDFCEAWDASDPSSQPGLPLVDRFDIEDRTNRSSLRETADYTATLLKKSLSCKMADGLYFFTEYIVKSYLARLYFWTEDWDGTVDVCTDIMKNSGIKLTSLADYADMIQSAKDKKGEVIVRSHINDASELDWYFSYEKGYIRTRPASMSFVRLFGEKPSDDVRFGVCLDSKLFNNKTPEMRIRMSEILLMLSEAYCHQGNSEKALELLNSLRRERIAGVQDYTAATLPAVRKGDRICEDAEGKALSPLLQAIFDERRKELFMEGDRWYELKRNGCPEWWIINNGLKYTVKEYLYTAPIYKSDVDLNTEMKQNKGYE